MALERLTKPSIGRIVGSTDQVNVSTVGVDKAVVTLSLPQMIGTGSSPQFLDLSITGTANIGTLNSGAINSNSSITVYNFSTGANTVIDSYGTISLVNTMSGIQTYVYTNGTIKTSNSSSNTEATINANGYVTFRATGLMSNSYVDLNSNGYISVANGNMMSNTRVDTFSNGFMTIANSSFMSNTKVDIASNAYILVENTTANTKIELFGNGQANVGALLVNGVQVYTNNASSNNVLIYNGFSFAPGNVGDASNSGTKGIATFNSTHFSVSSGNVSLSANMYQTAQTTQSNSTSVVLSNIDAGKLILMNTVGNAFVNVSSTTGFTPGQSVDILVLSNTMITFSNNGSAGVTMNGTPGVNTRAQYSAATIICTSANNYVVIGDLKV